MSVSVVVPCYRSERTLGPLVARLVPAMGALTPDFEVILVVDGSPDGTWDVARRLAVAHGPVEAVRLSRNYGQHNALVAGIRLAHYDIVVTMDDDLQHPPEQIGVLLEALDDGAVDLVYGVPRVEEHGWARSLASRSVKFAMARGMNVVSAQDISAFRAFRTYLRDGFDNLSGDAALDVMLSWSTTRATSRRIDMDQRADGRSNYTPRMLMRHAVNMLLGYSTAPLRVVAYLGLLCAVFGIALLAVILYTYFSGETTVAGFTTIASMVAIFSGAQMLAIGVLGEYIARIHSTNVGRPTYVIRERTDVDAHPDIER